MQREIVKIDEQLCDGCAECIPNCHEGALQIIDGKARLISDLMCDGLGACLGHCPQGAITIEKREATPYNETEVMKLMIEKGRATIVAHLKHLKDHNEVDLFKEGIRCLKDNRGNLEFNLDQLIQEIKQSEATVHAGCPGSRSQEIKPIVQEDAANAGGCPGSRSQAIKPVFAATPTYNSNSQPSELRQWPVQMHLVNPNAAFFKNSDLLIAADCTAFTVGNFHRDYLKDKTLAIACPKLDNGKEIYTDKIIKLIDQSLVNTITVMMMEVPCCGGLLQIVKRATALADRKVPVKVIVISLNGEKQSEEWI